MIKVESVELLRKVETNSSVDRADAEVFVYKETVDPDGSCVEDVDCCSEVNERLSAVLLFMVVRNADDCSVVIDFVMEIDARLVDGKDEAKTGLEIGNTLFVILMYHTSFREAKLFVPPKTMSLPALLNDPADEERRGGSDDVVVTSLTPKLPVLFAFSSPRIQYHASDELLKIHTSLKVGIYPRLPYPYPLI